MSLPTRQKTRRQATHQASQHMCKSQHRHTHTFSPLKRKENNNSTEQNTNAASLESHYCTKVHHSTVNFLTARRRILSEKLTGPELVRNFSEFYKTRRLITALTTARHLSLSRDINPIHAPISLLDDPFEYYPPIYA